MGSIKCFSVCSYRKILEWRLFKSFYVKTFITSWPAVCRMGRNILPDPSSCFWCEPLSWVFAAGLWSSINIRCTPPSTQHGICTDYCFIMKMKSNCYEVILRLNKPKTMDSSLINDYYQLLESHGLLHFVLSVFIYMKCYFIQDFIVIKVRWNPILSSSFATHIPHTERQCCKHLIQHWKKEWNSNVGQSQGVKIYNKKSVSNLHTNTMTMLLKWKVAIIIKTVRSYSDSSQVKN